MVDGTTGGRGITYETRLCMLLACRGYMKGLKNFRLRHQVPESEAGKFDDVVFDEGGGIYLVFQLKHKERGQNKISKSQLFSETFNADYNLLKYVKSVIDMKSNNSLQGEVRMAVLFTNIDFELQKDSTQLSLVSNRKDWYQEFTNIQLDSIEPDKDAMFSFPNAKYYKFDNDPNIIHILKRQSVTVSKELPQKVKMRKDSKPKYKDQQNKLKENDEAVAKVLKDFTAAKIQEALQYIVYAVQQPNDKELEKLIKDEIKDYFKLQDANTVYNALENSFTKWCNTKDPLTDLSPNPHIIQFKDAEIFFQKNVKKISFGFFLPTSSFTGRADELNRISEKLKENSDLIVSQSVKISGLGGIGKTELTKQFIKEFGQSNFYGRVIWIEAESDKSVKKSFKGLAEKIEIQDWENKSTKIIIDKIFDYFHGLKVLFVFDNFDNNTDDAVTYSEDKEKHFVIYCQKTACDPTKNHRPYFIFTSRNRECLPGVPSLDLSVLTEKDANELIKKGLIAKNYTNEDVEALVKTLQYFPLALQQAIAYINRQHKIKSVSGGGYGIQNYLTEFVKKTKKLLKYPYLNDFGEFGRTTWITWNVTFDAIRKDKTNGAKAIKVLQFMSYLYADKIDAKMFLSLFKNDLINGKAFLLLEKYSIITKIGQSTFQVHRLVQAVVQSKFKEKESDILKIAWKLIFPELYESYFNNNKDWHDWHRKSELIKKCTFDQILHYNSLATYIKTYEELNIKFQYFIDDLNERVLLDAFYDNDIDKIKKLQLSPKALKNFAVRNINFTKKIYSGKVVKYFIENGYLELNTKILVDTIEAGSLDMFKLMVEKGANLKDLLFGPTDLIYDIIQGKPISFRSYIKNKETEENVRILEESLFFAFLFNRERIVKLLINKKVSPDYKFYRQIGYAPIKAAVELNYRLRILLKAFDKPEVKDKVARILFDFLHDEKLYNYKNCFEILLKKYLELGGDINDKHKHRYQATFLTQATQPDRFEVEKIEIVNFFLDNGADPYLMSFYGHNALFNVIIKINDPYYIRDTDDKVRLYNMYRKMRSKISTEKFMSSILKRLCIRIKYDGNAKVSDDLFQYINDIKFRNDKGETLLIYVIRSLKTDEKSTIILILEAGVDVNAKDNDGKDALYYALDLRSDLVFIFLLTKVSAVSEEILMKAIKADKFHCVKPLLKTHFKLNYTFEDGKAFLEIVFENLSLKTMRYFHDEIKEFNLEKEEVERIYKKGKMALIKYIKNCFNHGNNVKSLNVFLEISTDVNATDSDGNNALHYATDLEDIETFKFLLSKGSKVLEKTLVHAIRHDKLQIVQAIIPTYFKKDHLFTNNGSTPLNLSAEFNAKEVQNFLTSPTSPIV